MGWLGVWALELGWDWSLFCFSLSLKTAFVTGHQRQIDQLRHNIEHTNWKQFDTLHQYDTSDGIYSFAMAAVLIKIDAMGCKWGWVVWGDSST